MIEKDKLSDVKMSNFLKIIMINIYCLVMSIILRIYFVMK